MQRLYKYIYFLQIFDSKKILWYYYCIFKNNKNIMATNPQNDEDLIILTDDIQTDSSDEMVINLDWDDSSTDDDVILTFDDTDEESTDLTSDTNTTDQVMVLEDDPFSIISNDDSDEISNIKVASTQDSDDIDLDFGSLDLEDNSKSDKEEAIIDIPQEEDNKEEETLDFGSFDDTEEKIEVVTDENKEEVDMDMGFGSLDVDEKIETTWTVETLWEEEVKEEEVSFWMNSQEEVMEDISTNSSIWTMESILDDTIAKLTQRQEIIHSEEEKQVLVISHLEEEIKQLESEKSQAENKKLDLEAEDKKIKTNITQLDKMKAAAEIKPEVKNKK